MSLRLTLNDSLKARIAPSRKLANGDTLQTLFNIVRKCYVNGIDRIDDVSNEGDGVNFISRSDEQRGAVLSELDTPRRVEQSEECQRLALQGTPVKPALQQISAEIDLGFMDLLVLHTPGFLR